MINLYESTAIDFSSNGLGHLTDAVSCLVLEERNGEFELEMEYPITGRLFNEISQRRIITAKSNPYSTEQAFRIYSITKPINGIIIINAAHICYDLTGYPVSPFTAESIGTALIKLVANSVVDCPFTFSTDKSTVNTMTRDTPSSMKSTLGGTDNSILSIYGGEYEYDNFNVKLWNNRGVDRGVSIRYGKNLTDLEQEENCSNLYTGVYPFWHSEEEGLMELTDTIVYVDGAYDFTKIYTLDLSDVWQEKPTEEELLAKAEAYISNNNIGIPKVSLTVSFIQLSQSEEYKNFAIMEMVKLCDTVSVEFPELNVSAISQCISTTYNPITDRYESVQLGEATSNLATSLVGQSESINKVPTKTFMEQAIINATNLITGGLGGYVILHNSAGENHPDEILIMNTDNIQTATNVWRWNQNGLGFSSTGYSGSYATAITIDGKIVADFIQTGTLSANMIESGIISSKNNSNYWDLDTGEFKNSAYSTTTEIKEIFSYTVTSTTVEYSVSASSDTAPTDGWSSYSPTWEKNNYIWSRTKTIYFNNLISYSEATCIQGAKGADGENGADGVSYYTWLKYADSPTSGMSESPTDKTYIGLAYNKTSITESSDYGDYTWSLIKGEDGSDGINGVDGADGQQLYTWIKYAVSNTGSDMSNDPTGREYIGIAYNKNTSTESNTASDYIWSLIKGVDGVDGVDGENGLDGQDGTDGSDGVNGADGTTIVSITAEYYLSTSKTELTGGSWQEISPTWETGKYIWTRSKIVYENPSSTEYTEPLCDSSWEAVDDLNTQLTPLIEQNTSNISQTADSIRNEVATTYLSNNEFAEYKATTIEQTDEKIEFQFNQLKSITDSTSDALQEEITERQKYIKFEDGAIELGEENNKFQTVIDNEAMKFKENGETVAHISNKTLNVTDADIEGVLDIAGFRWIKRDNGNMSLVKI